MKKTVLLFILISTVLAVCAQQPSQKEQKKMRKEIGLPDNFVYIPQGDSSFWMLKTEVTNEMIFQMLRQLKIDNSEELINSIKKKFYENYFLGSIRESEDTSFFMKNYPVANIADFFADLYCKYLNTTLLDTSWEYRLPTKDEWIYAAKAGNNMPYAWSCPFLYSQDGKRMCNFLEVGEESIHRNNNGELEILLDPKLSRNKYLRIQPVIIYSPNDWGLYNMCGNVAEMVLEKGIAVGGSCGDPGFDVQINSTQVYNGTSPKVGFRPILAKKKK